MRRTIRDEVAVKCKCDRCMALERLQARARRRVPELDDSVVRCRREPVAARREHDRSNPVAVALERLQERVRRRVPAPNPPSDPTPPAIVMVQISTRGCDQLLGMPAMPHNFTCYDRSHGSASIVVGTDPT
jgi:hypothetical protein